MGRVLTRGSCQVEALAIRARGEDVLSFAARFAAPRYWVGEVAGRTVALAYQDAANLGLARSGPRWRTCIQCSHAWRPRQAIHARVRCPACRRRQTPRGLPRTCENCAHTWRPQRRDRPPKMCPACHAWVIVQRRRGRYGKTKRKPRWWYPLLRRRRRRNKEL